MTFAAILEILLAILKFPSELSAFVRLISKSPEEKRSEIMLQVNAWMDASASGERPKWEGQ
jgi:hypothetical protein